MSISPDRVRARGRSPAFNALAATFENPNARNLSTPPPMVRKIYPKSVTPDSGKLASRSAAIAALTASFQQPITAPATAPSRLPKGKCMNWLVVDSSTFWKTKKGLIYFTARQLEILPCVFVCHG